MGWVSKYTYMHTNKDIRKVCKHFPKGFYIKCDMEGSRIDYELDGTTKFSMPVVIQFKHPGCNSMHQVLSFYFTSESAFNVEGILKYLANQVLHGNAVFTRIYDYPNVCEDEQQAREMKRAMLNGKIQKCMAEFSKKYSEGLNGILQ